MSRRNTIIGLGVALTTALVGTVIGLNGDLTPLTINTTPEIADCEVREVSLDMDINPRTQAVERRFCMDTIEYAELKSSLLAEYEDETKAYDFDINFRPFLHAVIRKEMEDSEIQIENLTSKEQLRIELINLLRPDRVPVEVELIP